MIPAIKFTTYGRDGSSTVEISQAEFDRLNKMQEAVTKCAKDGVLRLIGSDWVGCLWEADFKALCESVGLTPQHARSED